MTNTDHARRTAARADALVNAQLAFALNGYSFEGLPGMNWELITM